MGESSVGGSVLSGAVRRSYAGPAPRGYGAELLVDDNRRTASAISSGVARMICCGLCGSAGAGLKIFGSIPFSKTSRPPHSPTPVPQCRGRERKFLAVSQ